MIFATYRKRKEKNTCSITFHTVLSELMSWYIPIIKIKSPKHSNFSWSGKFPLPSTLYKALLKNKSSLKSTEIMHPLYQGFHAYDTFNSGCLASRQKRSALLMSDRNCVTYIKFSNSAKEVRTFFFHWKGIKSSFMNSWIIACHDVSNVF